MIFYVLFFRVPYKELRERPSEMVINKVNIEKSDNQDEVFIQLYKKPLKSRSTQFFSQWYWYIYFIKRRFFFLFQLLKKKRELKKTHWKKDRKRISVHK